MSMYGYCRTFHTNPTEYRKQKYQDILTLLTIHSEVKNHEKEEMEKSNKKMKSQGNRRRK